MAENTGVRWVWLKAMYVYTIVGSGGFGLAVLLVPNTMRSMFGWPDQDPIVLGITGSVNLAFALLSIPGLRAPLRFTPVLLLQLCYKAVWFVGVTLPMLAAGRFPPYGAVYALIFASYIAGDLVAIPFSYVFRATA